VKLIAVFYFAVSLWASQLTVVSLNLAEKTAVALIVAEIERVDQIRNADVFLLQEVIRARDDPSPMPDTLARALKLHVEFAGGDEMENGMARGIAILSRYPLSEPETIELNRHRLGFKNRRRVALGVTVNSPLGRVRVFDLHLDNRLNSRHKVEQLTPVLQAASAFDGPRIIGGDFNTGNIFWFGHVMPVPGLQKQSHAVRGLMAEHGYTDPFGRIGSTFDYFSLRLDWIWLKQLSPLATGVAPMGFSDHHAIWVTLAENPGRVSSSAHRQSTQAHLSRPFR
jgi:endonuclease/exonuclease/phosphatase family metal-dependent hydrolase